MLTTKQEIVQEVLYAVYGGPPPNDAVISQRYVLRQLNDKIAAYALKSASMTYQVDGVFQTDDVFRLTYTNLPLSQDSVSGMKYTPLPAQPVGLPRMRSFDIYPPANRGGVQASMFRPIGRDEVQFVRSIPGLKRVYYYIENGNINFIDNWGILQHFTTVNLSLVTSGANNLTDSLNLPDDMADAIHNELTNECRQILGLTDVTPLPAADAPQPR